MRLTHLAAIGLVTLSSCATPWGVRLSDHKEEIIQEAVKAAEAVANDPSIGTAVSEIGGLLSFAIAIALGGKTVSDRRKFKKLNGG